MSYHLGQKLTLSIKPVFGKPRDRSAEVFQLVPQVLAQTELGYTMRLVDADNGEWSA